MNGARFVHDTLDCAGWDVAIADAVKVKGLAPLAAKTDRIDARVLAELCRRRSNIWSPWPQPKRCGTPMLAFGDDTQGPAAAAQAMAYGNGWSSCQ